MPLARSGEILRSATFGCVPVSDDPRMRAHLNDLCGALSAALRIAVRPHRAPSPAALASAFSASRVHLAWASPALAVTEPAFASAVPLVRSVREGVSRYHGVLFSRADGSVRSLADLSGATAAWVARTSAGGYLLPRLALEREGIAAERLFGRELWLHSHGAVAEAVRVGRADVGATFAVFEHGDSGRPLVRAGFAPDGGGLDTMHVLAISPSIPSDVVLASTILLDTLSVDAVDALEALGHHESAAAAMRQVLGADGFVRCTRAELDELREQLVEARSIGAAG